MVVYIQCIHISLEQYVSDMSCCFSLMLLVFLRRVSLTLCLMKPLDIKSQLCVLQMPCLHLTVFREFCNHLQAAGMRQVYKMSSSMLMSPNVRGKRKGHRRRRQIRSNEWVPQEPWDPVSTRTVWDVKCQCQQSISKWKIPFALKQKLKFSFMNGFISLF